jgi:hypothetical protein
MIVLHKEKIIFLKARKVGGTSFEIALSQFADKNDIITPITLRDDGTKENHCWRGAQNYHWSLMDLKDIRKKNILKSLIERPSTRKFWNHIPASEAKQKLGERIWKNYTKVSIIRNPFDYMVSSYFWETGDAEECRQTNFQDYVFKNPEKLLFNKKIYEIDGKNVIDVMLRFDRLHEDIAALERRYHSLAGLAKSVAGLNAKGHYRPKEASVEEMYKNAGRAHSLIYNACIEDIEKYGFYIPEIK